VWLNLDYCHTDMKNLPSLIKLLREPLRSGSNISYSVARVVSCWNGAKLTQHDITQAGFHPTVFSQITQEVEFIKTEGLLPRYHGFVQEFLESRIPEELYPTDSTDVDDDLDESIIDPPDIGVEEMRAISQENAGHESLGPELLGLLKDLSEKYVPQPSYVPRPEDDENPTPIPLVPLVISEDMAEDSTSFEPTPPKRKAHKLKPLRNDHGVSLGTGRRKSSCAYCIMWPGTGNVNINSNRTLENWFPGEPDSRFKVLEPFALTGTLGQYDINLKIKGGGPVAQGTAGRLAVSRALRNQSHDFFQSLSNAGFLRSDPRDKERKQVGRKKARKLFRWKKR